MHNISTFQQYIYISKYARFLHDEERREVWPETVKRYFDFFTIHLKEMCNYSLTPELRKELEDAVLNFRVMPSMRCIMTAGPALQRENVSGFNCLGKDTLVTTKEYGIIPIGKLKDKTVHIVDGKGNWVLSTCKSYGIQDLYNVEYNDSPRSSSKVKATKDHNWVLNNNDIIKTSQLKPGDRLAFTKMPERLNFNVNSDDYKKGVIHGLVYGDGTALYKTSKKNLHIEKTCKMFVIRLCGESKTLLPFFENYTVSYPKSFNGEPVVYITDRSVDLKTLPNDLMNDDYKIGFIRGWFAADGCSGKINKQVSMSCTLEGKEWLYKNGPRYNFTFLNEYKYPNETNYGPRKQTLFRLEIDRRWLDSEDFILQYKKDNFSKVNFVKNPGFAKIKSIEYSGPEEVFCFNVSTTHSFLLTKNVLTGNCSFAPIDNPKSFAEILYILMCGTGLGFSVERQYVNKLPEVPEELYDTDTCIIVHDSKLGWAKALNELITLLYSGLIPKWDISKLRPAGAILKTFGGRSSGGLVLENLFKFIIKTFKEAKGRNLTSLECHDIVCKIGDCVVVGGVRRSALISLSNLSDDRMRNAKNGQWWIMNPHRSISNNSAVYNDKKPTMETFISEWKNLYDSKSGERGIFSRYASKHLIERSNKFRLQHFENPVLRSTDAAFGTNPCSEIILRPNEFCNLSEAVVRYDDTFETLKQKVRIAAILGTFQSTLTNYRFISKKWTNNVIEERLLGVSLTGIMDNLLTNGTGEGGLEVTKQCLTELRKEVIRTNYEFAKLLNISPSVACTAVKPSGTVSSLVNSASGIHARHSQYYIRTVRSDKKDPVSQLMIDQGVYYENDKMHPDSTYVFYFPQESPTGAIFRENMNAISQLEMWKVYQLYWCDHKPSITVSVLEDEWMDVGAWVYKNFEILSGVSFLPFSDHIYEQAPFQAISKDDYAKWLEKTPKSLDWSKLTNYEKTDMTTGAQELACSAGAGAEGKVSEGCIL